MSEKTRGPVTNVVYIFCGEKVVKKFSAETATEDAKNPMQQAKLFLKGILDDEMHEHHKSLTGGDMFYVSGHPQKIETEVKPTISM